GDNHNALYEIPVKRVESDNQGVVITKRSYFWQESGIICNEQESDGKLLVMFDASSRKHLLVGFHTSQDNGFIEEHTPVWPHIEWIKEHMKHADDANEDEENDYEDKHTILKFFKLSYWTSMSLTP
uniref:Uncharacterized protein n=1 Tax=Romanomermis culicivorax TaxID=13658 RepID=A0A915K2R9_ROMCU